MNDAHGSDRAVDGIQRCLTDFACALDYESLPHDAIHAAKALTIDTLGVLVAGFCHDPCRMARGLATPADDNGATIIGCRMKTTPDMAAFVNATTARYVEANDVYARYKAGCPHGHPSDVIMPVLAAAEHAHASGRDLITAIVLAYEIYLILDSRIKPRPARALTIPSILAAEKLAHRFKDVTSVKRVLVEVHRQAKHGTGPEYWHPETRESADHSIPYLVAAALLYGEVTARSFTDSMLRDQNLRALMTKIEIAADEKFTRAFEGVPQQYRARVTVTTIGGETLVAESGGDEDDLAAPKDDAAIARKFRAYAEDLLGSRRTGQVLDRLWHLEAIDRVAEIPRLLVLA